MYIGRGAICECATTARILSMHSITPMTAANAIVAYRWTRPTAAMLAAGGGLGGGPSRPRRGEARTDQTEGTLWK